MIALITKENRPKVRQFNGNVSSLRMFPRVALRNDKIATPTKRVSTELKEPVSALNGSPKDDVMAELIMTDPAKQAQRIPKDFTIG